MKRLLLALISISCWAQAPAVNIGRTTCPTSTLSQVVVAVSLGTLGGFPIIHLTCANLDPNSFKLDLTVTPPVLSTVITSQSAPINFVDSETPAGNIDGTNTIFTIATTPAPQVSFHLYLSGLLLRLGIDYTLNGQTIMLTSVNTPQPGENLQCSYRR